MRTLLDRLRTWALLRLAGGRPVALNLRLTRGLYLQPGLTDGLFVNVQVDLTKERPGTPDGVGVYVPHG